MPCKAYAPVVHRIADRYQGKIKVGKFDVGPRFKLGGKYLEQYGFNSIPHVILFKGGEPRMNFDGAPSEAELAKAIDGLL